MKFHLVSAVATGLLWACPSSAFQPAKPFIARATAPRQLNIGPLMDSAEKELEELAKGNIGAVATDASEETSGLTPDQAKVISGLVQDLDTFMGEGTGDAAADKQKQALVGKLVAELAAKDYTDNNEDPDLEKRMKFLLTKIMEYRSISALNTEKVGTNASSAKSSAISKIIMLALKDLLDNGLPMGYATYPRHAEYPDVDLSGLMKMVNGMPGTDYWFSFKKTLRVLVRAFRGLAGLATNPLTATDTSSVDNYQRIFKNKDTGMDNELIPPPKHAIAYWTKDEEFARQFLNGVNPVMIEVVKDSTKLTPQLTDFFASEPDVDVATLIAANELFCVDYIGLADLTKMPHQAYPEAYNNDNYLDPSVPYDQSILDKVGNEPRYFKAPMIVFRKAADQSNIEIIGIQLDRGDGAKVFTSANSGANEWLFAKTTVATADSQYHEWLTHLGKTHLTMEPHIVAIHNTLKKSNHKIYPFVKPMCRDTLFLNYFARRTLAEFGPDSFGDYMTSVGTGQYMQVLLKYWEGYHFFESSSFDQELESRGFTSDVTLGNYRYRTDGQKIWDAYGRFTTSYVDELFVDDAEVASDVGLQEWAHETTTKSRAAINGFPEKFETKAVLASTLQTLFWICSGFHAAVNFPQYDYFGYQANKPLGIRKSFEDWQAATGDEDWIFEEAMPHLDKAQESLLTVQVLTLPSKHTILDLDYCFETAGNAAYTAFKAELNTISSEIAERGLQDEREGMPAYNYLKPENIPASIDI